MGTGLKPPPARANARVRPPILIRDGLEDYNEMGKIPLIEITWALDKWPTNGRDVVGENRANQEFYCRWTGILIFADQGSNIFVHSPFR